MNGRDRAVARARAGDLLHQCLQIEDVGRDRDERRRHAFSIARRRSAEAGHYFQPSARSSRYHGRRPLAALDEAFAPD